MTVKIIALLAALALTASSAVASGPHETTDVSTAKGKWAGFEFKKTKEFIREMETRPDFPVSVPLAYDYVYSLRAMGDTIQPARKKSIIEYLRWSQQDDGGFIGDKSNKTSSALFTDTALETLSYLERPGAAETEKAKKFVLSLKNPDGGFGFSSLSRESTLATTYYAVKILASAKSLGSVDKARTAGLIKGFEKKETGGFGYEKGKGNATAKATYMALYTLNALGMLDNATKNHSLRYLESLPCGKHGGKERTELNELAFAVQGAKLLKAKDAIDAKKVTAFLKAIYIPVNGGFAPLEGYGSTPDSTTTALRIFAETEKLKTPAPVGE
jgi:prenyltransferase beta subunit